MLDWLCMSKGIAGSVEQELTFSFSDVSFVQVVPIIHLLVPDVHGQLCGPHPNVTDVSLDDNEPHDLMAFDFHVRCCS